MIENPFIVAWRKKFIIQIREYRAAGRPIYYLDESYYHQFSTRKKVWIDSTVVSAADVCISHLISVTNFGIKIMFEELQMILNNLK